MAIAVTAAAALTAAGLAGTAHASSTTLYVGGTGCSDGNNGSQSAPFCSITRALSGITAGTTVLVAPGTYNESVSVTASGTSGSPITIQSTTRGAATVAGGAHGFSVSGAHYVTIDGFTVSGTSGEGILLSSSSNLVVSNNTVTGSGQQVQGQTAVAVSLSGVTASQITGNHADHNSDKGFLLQNGTTGVTVSGNEASFNANGYYVNGVLHRDANGIDVISAGNTILGNVLHDNEDSGLQFYPGGDNNLAADNVTYNNGDHGIDDLNVTGGTLIGNTVFDNCTDGINVEGTSSNYTVENNVSTDNAVNTACAHGPAGQDGKGRAGEIGIYDSATTGTTVDYNVVYSTSGTDKLYEWGANGYTTLAAFRTGSSGQGAHDVVGNPGFVNASAGDFHLTEGSPAIDSANSGVAGQQNSDLDGHARVDDPNVANTGAGPRAYDDRGAYEFGGSSQPVLTAALSVSPNSGTAPLTVTADGSGSTPGTAAIASYTFSFGDGSAPVTVNAPATTAQHQYTAAGNYTVTLTVTDANSVTSAPVTRQVSVTDPAGPTAHLAVTPTSGTVPVNVSADGSGSTAGTAAITSYSIDFGDGSAPQPTATASHTYTAAGTYTVTLTVTDANNQKSMDTKTVLASATTPQITWVGRPASDPFVGSTTGRTMTVTAPTNAGDALIISVYLTGATGCVTDSGITAADTGHNTYSTLSFKMDASNHCTAILAAFHTNPLTTTDTITVSWVKDSKDNITVDEFSGVGTFDTQTTATGAAGGTTFTTPAINTTGGSELLFSAVGTNSGTAPTFDTTAGWNQLTSVALSSYRITSAWKIVTPGGYAAAGTTTAQWGATLAAVK